MGLVLGLRKGTEEVRGKRKVEGKECSKEMDDKINVMEMVMHHLLYIHAVLLRHRVRLSLMRVHAGAEHARETCCVTAGSSLRLVASIAYTADINYIALL